MLKTLIFEQLRQCAQGRKLMEAVEILEDNLVLIFLASTL